MCVSAQLGLQHVIAGHIEPLSCTQDKTTSLTSIIALCQHAGVSSMQCK